MTSSSTSISIFLSLFIEYLILNSLITYADCGHELSFENDTSSEEQVEEPVKCSNFVSRQDAKVRELLNLSELYETFDTPDQHLVRSSSYYNFPEYTDTRLFYYFFRPQDNVARPIIIWLGGYPGETNNIAVFYGNGPFRFARDSNSLGWNDNGWHKVANMLFIDQPVGVGFSNLNKSRHMRTTRSEGLLDLYHFVVALLFEIHPEYKESEVYIGGESYLANYAYGLAFHIQKANIADRERTRHIFLKGVVMGNPLIDLRSQHSSIPEFARLQRIISDGCKKQLEPLVAKCKSSVRKCRDAVVGACHQAFIYCNDVLKNTVAGSNITNMNYRNIRGPTADADYSKMIMYLSDANVKSSLGAAQGTPVISNSKMYDTLSGEWAKDTKSEVAFLLNQGIRCLVYAGVNDLLFNYEGTRKLLSDPHWIGREAYTKIATTGHDFLIDGVLVGIRRQVEALTFMEVLRAGNMVTADQPKVAREMLVRWMHNIW